MKLTEMNMQAPATPDTHALITALRDFYPMDYDWTFCFYTSKKSRDGVSLEFGKCEMAELPSLTENIKTLLLEKVLQERNVASYTPFLPAEMIGALGDGDELIRDAVADILFCVKNALPHAAEDFALGLCPAPTGYILSGLKKQDDPDAPPERMLFMRRGNPFVKGGKNLVCISKSGDIALCDAPVMRFTAGVDLILTGGFCYFVSPAIEKDFGMESRHTAIAAKRLDAIAGAELVNNYEELEGVAYGSKNVRKFVDFDPEILGYIQRLERMDREEFLSNYGITLDVGGKISTDDPEQCELLIDLLCCRSCHDALGRLAMASNIVPR